MKMKNMLIGGMSLALVACISVGGTLAYLTDTDDKVTNTFDFVSQGITLDLWEQYGTSYAGRAGTADPSSLTYTDLVSDEVREKDVNIDYETGAEAYVFVNIQPNGAMDSEKLILMSTVTEDEVPVNKQGKEAVEAYGWTAYGEVGEDGYGIYYKKVAKTTKKETLSVFDKIKVGSYTSEEADAGIVFANIEIKTAAIQTATFDSVDDAYAEIATDLDIPTML